MAVPLDHVLMLSFVLLLIGIVGLFVRKDALTIFLSVQIMLQGANIAFAGVARSFGDTVGHVVMVVIMFVAIAEAVIGFSIVIYLHQVKKPLEVKRLKELRG